MDLIRFSDHIDLTGILGKYTVSKIIDNIIRKINVEIGKKSNRSINNTQRHALEDAIVSEFKKAIRWSSVIKDNQFNISFLHKNIYVDLDIFLAPVTSSISSSIDSPKDKFNNIFNEDNESIIILGYPGSGKTTLMKNFCNYLAHEFKAKKLVPIVVLLRDLDKTITDTKNRLFLFRYLVNCFKIDIKFGSDIYSEDIIRDTIKRCVIDFLEEWKVVLILDGFDEVVELKRRELLREEILSLTQQCRVCRIILTSRFGENLPINQYTSIFQIAPLNDKQIGEFISKYLHIHQNKQIEFKQSVINSSFSDTIRRPLTLAYYCYYFDHYGFLPDQPSSLYSKVTKLLLEEWSKINSVKRLSIFSNFNFDIKAKFLREFAFWLTVKYKKLMFNERIFEAIYMGMCEKYKLLNDDCKKVLEEIQSHNGLIIPIDGQFYTFAHKSIQEYFVADYIVRLGRVPIFSLEEIPDEIAIAIAISDDPNRYFLNIVIYHRSRNLRNYSERLLNRLFIEKPLFYSDPILGLALISLYNDMKEIEIYDRGKKSYHKEDRSIFKEKRNSISLFFNDPVFIKSIQLLLGTYYYAKPSKKYKEKDCNIFFFKRNKTPIGLNYEYIPKYIALTDKYILHKV